MTRLLCCTRIFRGSAHRWPVTCGTCASEHRLAVLIARQDVAGTDRSWARHYQVGDVIRYTRGSRAFGFPAGTYARVAQVHADENQLTVRRHSGKEVTYDPQRLSGVTLYREADRAFSVGDRIQFTAPNRPRHLANRELGTLERIDANGHLQIRLDSGRTTRFRIGEHPHLDYGYAVTSYSSQGQTADRVLIYIDTAHASEQLVNRRPAYVAVSRARYDAQIYTNDKTQLAAHLQREVSHRSAVEASQEQSQRQHSIGLGH